MQNFRLNWFLKSNRPLDLIGKIITKDFISRRYLREKNIFKKMYSALCEIVQVKFFFLKQVWPEGLNWFSSIFFLFVRKSLLQALVPSWRVPLLPAAGWGIEIICVNFWNSRALLSSFKFLSVRGASSKTIKTGDLLSAVYAKAESICGGSIVTSSRLAWQVRWPAGGSPAYGIPLPVLDSVARHMTHTLYVSVSRDTAMRLATGSWISKIKSSWRIPHQSFFKRYYLSACTVLKIIWKYHKLTFKLFPNLVKQSL